MKKSALISSVLLISVIILLAVYIVAFSTVTYRGVIISSTVLDDYIEFTIAEAETSEHITILVDVHTAVSYCHHERDIYSGDLMNNTGCTVEISCKRYFNHNRYAESVVVQLIHESGNDDF